MSTASIGQQGDAGAEADEQVENRSSNDRIAAFFVLLSLVVVGALTVPIFLQTYGSLAGNAAGDPTSVAIELWPFAISWAQLSPELQVVVLAAAAGTLGAVVTAGWAASSHISAGDFGRKWVPWYFVRVTAGLLVAPIVVLAIAAGLVTGAASTEIEPSGVAVIGFVIGLASKKALDKLESLVDVLFSAGTETS